MSDSARRDRLTLALSVWAVLVSQVLLYPGVSDLVQTLGGAGDLDAGMWFLVSEYAAFVVFAGLWGALSDATGRRVPLIVVGALGGAACYLLLSLVPSLGVGFGVVLLIRVVGGAFTIGAFSLSMTMLMDLGGGNGRNMGAAGIAIGLGAAVGSIVGGRLSTADPLAPVYGAAALLGLVALLTATVTDRSPNSGVRDAGDSVDDDRAGPRDILRKVVDRPALRVPYAFGFIDRLTAGFFSLVGIYYFRDAFGLDAFGAGLVLAMFFGPFALLQYPMGVLSDRIGRFLPVVVGSILYGVSIIVVGASPSLPFAAVTMVLVGVFGALVSPATMALVTDIADADERGAAMGGFNIFGSLGFLTGFLLGGSSAELLGYFEAFVVVGFTEIGIALVASRAVRRLATGESVAVPGVSEADD
ncbi:MFS transporter [Haloprofundus marisrubri]|uniref:MFS transporter n=1 Tax=Haloprofundus marisrubri TaxID=1514971 RepID=A0A0W1RAN7_9EURY|nr:MFS transporter [Haloprofundus marisrubri]KTG10524.1 MFS transporter [Haloprofundus marisrubri]